MKILSMLSDLNPEEQDNIFKLITQIETKKITKTNAAKQLSQKGYTITLIAGIINSSIPSVSNMLSAHKSQQQVKKAMNKKKKQQI